MTHHVLVVDDEKNLRESLRSVLESEGFLVHEAENGAKALEALSTQAMDVIISDLRMPQMDGMELLKHVREKYSAIPFVVISAHASIETAVEAMKLGAFDFFTKPFDNSEVLGVVKKALKAGSLNENPQISDNERKGFDRIVGQSPVMQKVYSLIAKVAKSDSTVAIYGESGTGKEMVARTIHEQSPRLAAPFIAVNCAALAENLVESELFGHEKGAFTGAAFAKPGRFELASEGTLFLDEVGEIPLSIQTKLLRVLQEKSFERLGGIKSIKTNARLITATNKNIEEEVKKGKFREDLFYRLNVIPIRLPPLRERGEDIVALCNYFVDLFNTRMKKKIEPPSKEILDIFLSYSWPGNVRELENTIERMMVLSEGDVLDMEAMPERIRERGEGFTAPPFDTADLSNRLRMETDRVEKELLVKVLGESEGNRTQAAKKLGVSRKTIQNKIKEFGIA